MNLRPENRRYRLVLTYEAPEEQGELVAGIIRDRLAEEAEEVGGCIHRHSALQIEEPAQWSLLSEPVMTAKQVRLYQEAE